MTTTKVGRVLATLGVAAAATITPIAAAAPASAAASMYSGCLNYVKSKGYVVGPKVYAACSHQALNTGLGVWIHSPACLGGLVNIGVKPAVAAEACTRAH
ncbi:hypothetical protein ACFUJR_16240 [Streptomyces sp. NPDC057271]